MVIKRTMPPDLPPDVAKAFASDMQAFLVEKSGLRRDEVRTASWVSDPLRRFVIVGPIETNAVTHVANLFEPHCRPVLSSSHVAPSSRRTISAMIDAKREQGVSYERVMLLLVIPGIAQALLQSAFDP